MDFSSILYFNILRPETRPFAMLQSLRVRSMLGVFSLIGFLAYTPARADMEHYGRSESPYVVGSVKQIRAATVCFSENSARAVIEQLPRIESARETFQNLKDCEALAGIAVRTLRQIGADIKSDSGFPFRIIQAEVVDAPAPKLKTKVVYILTSGNDNYVVTAPELSR